VAVWLVRDCGLLTCQVTANFGAGYNTPKTTETLINYTACYRLVFIFSVILFSICYRFSVSRASGQAYSLTSFGLALAFEQLGNVYDCEGEEL